MCKFRLLSRNASASFCSASAWSCRLMALSMVVLAACSTDPSDEEKIEQTTLEFSSAYFNYDFKHAEQYLTPDSKKWIAYAASNIHDADLELLRKQQNDAAVQLEDVEVNDDDSTAIANVTVSNYMRLDTIGNAGRMITEARFRLTLVRDRDKWKVRMVGLPRSEK